VLAGARIWSIPRPAFSPRTGVYFAKHEARFLSRGRHGASPAGIGWQTAEDSAEFGSVRRVGRSQICTLHLPLPTDRDVHIRFGVVPVSAPEPAPVGLRANAQHIGLQRRRTGDGSLILEGTIPRVALASGKRLSEVVFRFGAQGVGVHSIKIHEVERQRPWRRILSRSGAECRCPPHAASRIISTPDGPFLVILARPAAGLFSLIVHVLRCLVTTPEMIPIVYYGKGAYRYWSDEGWNGSLNGWEYYFHPVSDYALDELLHVKPQCLARMSSRDIQRRLGTSSFIVTQRWRKFPYRWRHNRALLTEHNAGNFRELYGRLLAERIRVKDHVLSEVNEFWHRHLAGDRVIAIHYRSTDKPAELARRNKSIPLLSIDDHLDRALAVPGAADAKFFLATEDEVALELARERLGHRLVSIDATRSRDEVAPHFSVGGPRVGQEALVDCLLLSRCDYLVHGRSNLSGAAMLFNPRLEHADVSRTPPHSSR
jgi:hypothetical protein